MRGSNPRHLACKASATTAELTGHIKAYEIFYLVGLKRLTEDLRDHILNGSGLREEIPSDDQAGSALAGAPDIDGDGVDDILIGAPYFDESVSKADTGVVWLILGGGWP